MLTQKAKSSLIRLIAREIAFEFLSDLGPDNAEYRRKDENYRQAAETEAEGEWLVEEHCKGRWNGVEALVVSQLDYIKPRLRSPSTADFPGYTDDEVSVTFLNDCTFVVRTYVDAQNAFGATIRTRFLVKLQRDIDNPDAWRLIDLFTLD